MGRTKLWHENLNLTLPKGAKDRIDSVLVDGEDRLHLIRTAIDAEVSRRESAGGLPVSEPRIDQPTVEDPSPKK